MGDETLLLEKTKLEEHLRKELEENCQLRNKEVETRKRYLEEHKMKNKLHEKVSKIEKEYKEERQINSLYYDIFSKQKAKISRLEKDLGTNDNSNLVLENDMIMISSQSYAKNPTVTNGSGEK